jgi:hypothetical protein
MKRIFFALLLLLSLVGVAVAQTQTRYIFDPAKAPQEVTRGDQRIVYTTSAFEAELCNLFGDNGSVTQDASAVAPPSGPQFYRTTWTSEGGMGQEVYTTRRTDESVSNFRNRHRDAVEALREVFPPVPQPPQTGKVLRFRAPPAVLKVA